MLDTTYLPTQAKILAAVSGGADSLALLLALVNAKFEVVAGHVNHQLRGAESDGDERFVLELCAAQGIAVETRKVVCENSSEDAARQARYTALTEMAHAQNCAIIATGHTADDVLETVLMNWLRGAAVAGLAGIPACRILVGQAGCPRSGRMPADESPDRHGGLPHQLALVRPLLNATREETRAFCRAAGWEWREDSSNASTAFTRNRVRELLPLLAQAGAVTPEQLARQTARAAALWREESDFLDGLAAEHLALLALESSSETLALNGLRFAALPVPLARRVLRLAARQIDEGARETSAELVEAVRRHVAAAGRHAVWQWPGGVIIEWTGPLSGNRLVLRSVSGKPENSTELV